MPPGPLDVIRKDRKFFHKVNGFIVFEGGGSTKFQKMLVGDKFKGTKVLIMKVQMVANIK